VRHDEARQAISYSRFTLSALMGRRIPTRSARAWRRHHEVGRTSGCVGGKCSCGNIASPSHRLVDLRRSNLVGYLVCAKQELTLSGDTSLEVRVEVIAENPLRGETK